MRNDSDPEYVSFGYFDPLVAKRIMRRFSEHGVRFKACDASQLDMASAGIGEDTLAARTRSSPEIIVSASLFVQPTKMKREDW